MNRECAQCGADISHKRSNARFCDRTCKNAATHVRLRQGSEKERARNRARYANEAERRRAHARAAYWKDPEAGRERSRQYRRDHPDIRAAQNANRRARKYENGGYVGLPAREWERLVRRHQSRCAYCGTPTDQLERDHVIPLSKGGRHAPANILPACRPCNSSKGDRFLAEWKHSRTPGRR